jgi:hypothetical protein
LSVGASVQVRDGFSGEWQSGFVHGMSGSGRPRVKVTGHKAAFEWDEWRLDFGARPLSDETLEDLGLRPHATGGFRIADESSFLASQSVSQIAGTPSGTPSGGSPVGRRVQQRGWLGGVLSEEQLARRAESRQRTVRLELRPVAEGLP